MGLKEYDWEATRALTAKINAMPWSKGLKDEVLGGLSCMMDDQSWREDNDYPDEDDMILWALEEAVDMGEDYGGHYERGIIPELVGSPEWVAEMKAGYAQQEQWRKDWLKVWREAKRVFAKMENAQS